MMEAGRELDALVAEKVMGLEVLGQSTIAYIEGETSIHPDSKPEHWSCYAESGPIYLQHCVCEFKDEHDEIIYGHIVQCCDAVPLFSEEIGAAWEVVEVLTKKKEVTLEYYKLPTGDKWGIAIGMGTVTGFGDTAPLAICLAALKAEGVTVPVMEPDQPHQQ